MILDSVYNKLDEDKKNTISNSFNSVLDLSNEREGANTQKSLFSDFEWRDLKQKYKPLINWITLEPRITKKLKIIEKMAQDRMKDAYQKSLLFQKKKIVSQITKHRS